MNKKLYCFLVVLSFLFISCKKEALINPPDWLIGYWMTLDSSPSVIKAIEISKTDITLTKNPGDFSSLTDYINSSNPPSFKFVNSSKKEYRIRILGDLFLFEYVSKDEIIYKGTSYVRLVPE